MAQIKVYGYEKCSTCRNAQKFLKNRNLSYEIIDITKVPPTKKELQSMLKVYSGEVKKLINTSGQAYRELGLSKKLPDMTVTQIIGLLAENGRLVKRPFLLVGSQAKRVGFKESEWEHTFTN